MAKGKILLDTDRCKGCALCIQACPQEILVSASTLNKKGFYPVEVASPELCTGCALCYQMCPDMVIAVYQEKAQERKVEMAWRRSCS